MWRSDEEMLEVVRRRAGAVQRRRRVVSATSLGAVLVVVTSLAFASRGGDGNTRVDLATGPTSTTSTTATAAGAGGAAAEVPADAPQAAAPPSEPAKGPAVAPRPRTKAQRQPAAGPAASTSPTAPPAPPPPPGRRCAVGDVVAGVATDKASYQPGEAVKATATIRNASSHPCLAPMNFRAEWTDASGRPLTGMAFHGDCFDMCRADWAPGEVRTQTPCWDQRGGPDGRQQVPAGTYGVKVAWTDLEGGAAEATAVFEVVASAPKPGPC